MLRKPLIICGNVFYGFGNRRKIQPIFAIIDESSTTCYQGEVYKIAKDALEKYVHFKLKKSLHSKVIHMKKANLSLYLIIRRYSDWLRVGRSGF